MVAPRGPVATGRFRGRLPRAYALLAVAGHVAFGTLLLAYAITLPPGTLGLLAAQSIVFLMLALTLAYLYTFGRTRPGPPRARSGPLGIGRVYLLFLMWLVLGFLAILLALGPELAPDVFVYFLLAWFALVAFYVASVAVWRRQNPPRWA